MENVSITRVSQHINRARKINIYLDNEKIASLKNGETKKLHLEAGTHTLFAKIDWCKTAPLEITITENSHFALEIGSDLNTLNPLAILNATFINTSKFIYLREIEL